MATILVVDDDPAARKPLARLLKMEGYEVVCAENAVMAMAAAMGRRPDLILLDVALPPMDGLTFLFLLREKPYGKDIAVIVISGQEDENTQRRARDLGVDEYLIKSKFKTRELLDLERRHCPSCAAESATTPEITVTLGDTSAEGNLQSGGVAGDAT
jgi:DNA-binding response OmpR family regulator